MMTPSRIATTFIAILFLASCKKSIVVEDPIPVPDPVPVLLNAPVVENFETGSKTSFAKSDVNLTSGSWIFDDAILANTPDDKKLGSQSARIQGNGSITAKFDVMHTKMVVITHASFGTNASSNWQLWISDNSGTSYYQVGNTVSSTSSLKSDTFAIASNAAIRISIRKVSGGANNLNIDDILISNQVVPIPLPNGDDSHLLMGNPSAATTDITNENNYLMNKGYFVLSYSKDRGIANWVSWHLESSDIGTVGRQDDFRSDVTLPSSWYRVSETSYSSSGFDRGHNCPSGDRTSNYAANSATFVMTNMIPQAPNNNQQTWASLEDYSRSLINQGNELYITMGSYGAGGTGSKGYVQTIDNGKVTVPAMIWKVIVVLPSGANDLARVSNATRVIAVNTPNTQTINSNWKTYRTTVDAIEEATGYNLLSKLPVNVQDALEKVVDNK